MDTQRYAPTCAGSVLVVDDDPRIRDLLGDFLKSHGFHARTAGDAAAMDRVLAEEPGIEVVILDVMMPGEDGLSACRRLADRRGPSIIMHSAMGEETDRVVGLELGADAYLAKPCSPRELLAQVRAVLRRQREPSAGRAPSHAPYTFDGWRLDPISRTLTAPDQVVIPLANREFMLLKTFLDQPQVVLSRDQLAEAMQGTGDADGRSIDVQISRVRRKLGDGSESLIRTFRKVGYMFTPKVQRG
jgi:two-component system OmpR family response regulator